MAGDSVRCRQPVLPAAFALALLYLTVLSFGLLATAYLNWRGMSEAELSIYRGLGAIAGISATFIFPPMHGQLGEPLPRHAELHSSHKLDCTDGF